MPKKDTATVRPHVDPSASGDGPSGGSEGFGRESDERRKQLEELRMEMKKGIEARKKAAPKSLATTPSGTVSGIEGAAVSPTVTDYPLSSPES